nr:hypothetical protein [Bacillus alkalicellulosilyticus]
MKIKGVIGVLFVLLVVTALFFTIKENQVVEDNQGKDIKELVNAFSAGHITDREASIQPNELIVTHNTQQQVYDLSEEDFFVSIAPFINETHP